MNIYEKASYIKGLADGLDLDKEKPEGKLILKLIDLVDEMAGAIADLADRTDTLDDYADELDSDLGDVEEYLFGDEEDDDAEDDDAEDGDEDFYEVECPNCGETVCFDDTIDPSSVTCPACGEKFDCTCTAEDCEHCSGCGSDEE